MSSEPLPLAVEMRGCSKVFGSFTANDRIDLEIRAGEVHALLGENGAGKTTLMKSLYGMHRPTEGTILVRGQELQITDPNVAIKNGIGMVHQHFMLVRPFTVTQNIILGMEPAGFAGVIDRQAARLKVQEISERYGLKVDPDAIIEDITVGMEQRVEILKALYRGAQILILDEPTAVLTPQEIEDLLKIIRNLTAEGKTVIIITHKLKEIKAIADRCTIIRRGKKVATVDVETVSEQELAMMMVGREVSFKPEKSTFEPGDIALQVQDLVVKDNRGLEAVRKLSLFLRKGEILGIAGVDGNGQSELAEALTGLRAVSDGTITLSGKEIQNLGTKQIIRERLVSIPQDRQRFGLVLDFSVSENLILQQYDMAPFSKRGVLDRAAIDANAKALIQSFDIRPPEAQYKASELSGGNQQKVIIAREVNQDPEVLIANQPTRGLDVGAIEYVHKSLLTQRENGKAVLLISLELDEILAIADRILVIYEGQIVGELSAEEADERKIGVLMAGGKNE